MNRTPTHHHTAQQPTITALAATMAEGDTPMHQDQVTLEVTAAATSPGQEWSAAGTVSIPVWVRSRPALAPQPEAGPDVLAPGTPVEITQAPWNTGYVGKRAVVVSTFHESWHDHPDTQYVVRLADGHLAFANVAPLPAAKSGPDPRDPGLHPGDPLNPGHEPGQGWEIGPDTHDDTWQHGPQGWGAKSMSGWDGIDTWKGAAGEKPVALVAFHPDRSGITPTLGQRVVVTHTPFRHEHEGQRGTVHSIFETQYHPLGVLMDQGKIIRAQARLLSTAEQLEETTPHPA